MKTSIHALLGALTAISATAGSRSSANYSIPADTADAGGRRVNSASYASQGCIGGIAGIGNVVAPAQIAKHGYLGQLYDVTGFAVGANPTNVIEGATRRRPTVPRSHRPHDRCNEARNRDGRGDQLGLHI